MFRDIKQFATAEDGAITADWVVLTAAIMGFALAAVASVENGVNELGPRISEEIENQMDGGG